MTSVGCGEPATMILGVFPSILPCSFCKQLETAAVKSHYFAPFGLCKETNLGCWAYVGEGREEAVEPAIGEQLPVGLGRISSLMKLPEMCSATLSLAGWRRLHAGSPSVPE